MNAKSQAASADPSGDREFMGRLSALTDVDFEQRLVVAFESLGYTVDRDTGHEGIDMMLQVADQVWLVRTRDWRNLSVEVEPVRKMIEEVNRNEATGGMVVCAGTFSDEARRRVRGTGVRLLNGVDLSGILLADVRNVDDEECPRCGLSLVERVSQRELEADDGDSDTSRRFRGCTGHPTCNYTQGTAA